MFVEPRAAASLRTGLPIVALLTSLTVGGLTVAAHAPARPPPIEPVAGRVTTLLSPPSLDPDVLLLALGATACAETRGLLDAPGTLTVIDYSKPSTDPRLWVLDLDSGQTLFEEVVAHGQGSGGNSARWFSNTPDSHQSSLGLFVTGETYVGENGYSLRLEGLEPGINDHARARAIVMHGAPYVDPLAARQTGRLGRSWGCPAVRPAVARRLIDRIRGGDPIFAYYPDERWTSGSTFLSPCTSASAHAATPL